MVAQAESSAQASARAKGHSRKRRRRAASYSVSSDDSSSEDEPAEPSAQPASSSAESSSSGASSDSSDSDSDDSSDSDSQSARKPSTAKPAIDPVARKERPRYPTTSPSPPPTAIPSFLPERTKTNARDHGADELQEDRRSKFRRIYMEKLVEGFGSDLEKLRAADPTLGPTQLQMLIDSLAGGMEIFNDPTQLKPGQVIHGVDEVGVIIGE